jgi:hypothetical protein
MLKAAAQNGWLDERHDGAGVVAGDSSAPAPMAC